MYVRITPQDVRRSVSIAREGKIPVKKLSQFSYGRVMDSLPVEGVKECLELIRVLGAEGAVVNLNILSMYCLHNDNRRVQLKSEIRQTLLVKGILSTDTLDSSRDGFHFEKQASRLLSESHDERLAVHIAEEVIRVAEGARSLNRFSSILDPTIRVLFSHYPSETWAILGARILGGDHTAYKLFLFLASDFNEDDGQFGLLFNLPEDILFGWCRNNSPQAPELLAKEIPLIRRNGPRWEPHPLGIKFIEEFGHVGNVTHNLSLNLSSFGWSGSPIPKYEAQKNVLELLLSSEAKAKTKQWARTELGYLQEVMANQIEKEEERTIGVENFLHRYRSRL